MDRLETDVNLLFDKLNAKDHKNDIFDDDFSISHDEYKHDEIGIELQPMNNEMNFGKKDRNPNLILPPIINQPKLTKWKKWRKERNNKNKKPKLSKSGYAVL